MTADQIAQVTDDPPGRSGPPTTRRAAIYPYLAAVWSLFYGGMALGWAVGVAGWPARPFDSVGRDLSPALGSALPPHLLAAIAMIGAGAAIAMANGWGRSVVRTALLGGAWVITAGLALTFVTEQVLLLVAYAPIYLVGTPFGWPPDSFLDHVTWPVVHEAICLLGAGLWAMAAVWYRRRTAGNHHAGNGAAADGPVGAQVLRRDRIAVAVAVAVPLLYALTRYAWLLGIPLGITEELLREGQAAGAWVAGAGLATFAVVGAVLTLGLVQRWGEVLPDWVPLLGGRRVPPALATVPATVVSVLLLTAGLSGWRQGVAEPGTIDMNEWAAVSPGLLLPVWGVALGVATAAYRRRRASTDVYRP